MNAPPAEALSQQRRQGDARRARARDSRLAERKKQLHYIGADSGTLVTINGSLAMGSVEERVKRLICDQLGVKEEEVKDEASFVDDLGADSLDTVELVMALEEEFETEIPDEEAENITTVKEAIDYILAHK